MSKRQVKLTATWSRVASKRRCLTSQDLPNSAENVLQAASSRSDPGTCAGFTTSQPTASSQDNTQVLSISLLTEDPCEVESPSQTSTVQLESRYL